MVPFAASRSATTARRCTDDRRGQHAQAQGVEQPHGIGRDRQRHRWRSRCRQPSRSSMSRDDRGSRACSRPPVMTSASRIWRDTPATAAATITHAWTPSDRTRLAERHRAHNHHDRHGDDGDQVQLQRVEHGDDEPPERRATRIAQTRRGQRRDRQAERQQQRVGPQHRRRSTTRHPSPRRRASHSQAKTTSIRDSMSEAHCRGDRDEQAGLDDDTASTPRPRDTGTPNAIAPSGPSARAGGTVPDMIAPHRPSGRSREQRLEILQLIDLIFEERRLADVPRGEPREHQRAPRTSQQCAGA